MEKRSQGCSAHEFVIDKLTALVAREESEGLEPLNTINKEG